MISYTTGAESGTSTKTVDLTEGYAYADRRTLRRWLQLAYRRGLERGKYEPPEIITGPISRNLYNEDCDDLIPRMFGDTT